MQHMQCGPGGGNNHSALESSTVEGMTISHPIATKVGITEYGQRDLRRNGF